jgi:hypothetical protein
MKVYRPDRIADRFRHASAALGSSLIAIGWLYSRYLLDDRVRR